MRVLFGCLAVLLGAVSISLAARYGYKGADTMIDGVISAVVFGAIALCACLFDAAAVRLWFMGHRIGAGAIGLIAAAALVVTFTNSLGAIAGRADVTQAERARAKDDVAADRAELARIAQERAAMRFVPATEETVAAARDAVTAAEHIRIAECGNGDPKQRGPNCRQRETEEQARREALTSALAGKAATDRAASLDSAAAAIRARLATALPVQNPNPLGAALALLLGAGAAALTAWQQAVVAAVFELCLVGVMVIYELLGHAKQQDGQAEGRVIVARSQETLNTGKEVAEPQLPKPSTPRRRKATLTRPKVMGSVQSFVRDHVFPADGERTEIKALMQDYRTWCAHEGFAPIELSELLDEIEKICRRLGVGIEVGDDQRVYCLNVTLRKHRERPPQRSLNGHPDSVPTCIAEWSSIPYQDTA
jgi:hypothetical protein